MGGDNAAHNTKKFFVRYFAVRESKGFWWSQRQMGETGRSCFYFEILLGEKFQLLMLLVRMAWWRSWNCGCRRERGVIRVAKPSNAWERMGSRGVKWLTGVTNLWVVGLALDPGNANSETLYPTNYIQYLSLGAVITITIPQEGSRGNMATRGITAVPAASHHCTQGLGGGREGGHGFMEGEGREIGEAPHD